MRLSFANPLQTPSALNGANVIFMSNPRRRIILINGKSESTFCQMKLKIIRRHKTPEKNTPWNKTAQNVS